MEDAWVALIAAVFGGAGLKIVEALIGRGQVKIDAATQMRSELRQEVITLRESLRSEIDLRREVEKEVDVWQNKYYDSLEEKARIIGLMTKHDIKVEIEEPKED